MPPRSAVSPPVRRSQQDIQRLNQVKTSVQTLIAYGHQRAPGIISLNIRSAVESGSKALRDARSQAVQKLLAIRQVVSAGRDHPHDVDLRQAHEAFAGVGNCEDLSFVAGHLLILGGIQSSELLIRTLGDEQVNHVFIVITPSSSAGAGICCDPWAGFVCYADEYLLKFTQRMKSIEDNGKMIEVPGRSPMRPTELVAAIFATRRCIDTVIR